MSLTAVTSSTACEAKLDSPIAVPRAAAARATATSPSGSTACTPVGEIITGNEISSPITVVVISRSDCAPTTCGAQPSSENARTLSSTVTPACVPATSDEYTDLGSRFLARRCASVTVSNQGLRAQGLADMFFLLIDPSMETGWLSWRRGAGSDDGAPRGVPRAIYRAAGVNPASGFSSQDLVGREATGVRSPSGRRVIRVSGVPREWSLLAVGFVRSPARSSSP